MLTIPIEQIVPDVRPSEGETATYWVQSRSRPDVEHRVDLTAYYGNGRCSCEAFLFKCGRDLERGAIPALRLECYHIRRARRYRSFQELNLTIKEKTAYANANKQAAKDKARALASGVPAAGAAAESGEWVGGDRAPDVDSVPW